jgi:transglutaminase-like putative cysteine protease
MRDIGRSRGIVGAFLAASLAACGDGGGSASASPAARGAESPKPPPAAAAPSKGTRSAPPSGAADAIPEGAIRRWYDVLEEGQKTGTLEVTWAPSTWNGHKTVRDVTTESRITARDMAGTTDVFSTETVSTTERGEDGTLWWQKSVTTEGDGRETVAETTWTGDGYDTVVRLQGTEQRFRVDTKEPTSLDVESAIGPRLARGELAVGGTATLRYQAARKKRVIESRVEVLAREDAPGEAGNVPCWKVRETDPESGSTSTTWIDADGAVARLKSLSTEIRRVSRAKASERPTEPPSFSITAPATPPIERIFSADRLFVDVKMRGDPDRPVPEFPTSPFSRVLGVEGSDAKGWTVHMRLDAYDAPAGVTTTIPVTDPAFADDLSPTILMPCEHPDVRKKARDVVGNERDARKAVQRIADFVFTLRKQSPDVNETTAVEILQEGRGDCSEHAVLFVALCRAAGIPARRCSGFVSVGEIWGAHAFAEVWVGAWMGVDPTTDDVGTAARYVFFGYSDAPDSKAGLVAAEARGRMRFEVTRLEEAGRSYDLFESSAWRVVDEKAKTASHRLAGIEAEGWPDGWKIRLRGASAATISGKGFTADLTVSADQGYRGERWLRRGGGRRMTTFAGATAAVTDLGDERRVFFVGSRRRRIQILLSADSPERLEEVVPELERVLAKTFEPSPHGW